MTGIITVASGKGGTGKTWFAASLAQALALRPGRRVLLVDGDWGLANADVQLGVMAPAVVPLQGAVEDLAAAVQPVPGAGIDLLAGASGSGRLADLPAAVHGDVREKVRTIARAYHWTVIDLAAGAERSLRDWWRLGRRRLLVVTPDPASMTDAYAFLKLCTRDGDAGRCRLVVNRAPTTSVGSATGEKLARACGHFLKLDLPAADVLLEDPRVTAAIRAQRPFVRRYPTAPMTRALEALAHRLDRVGRVQKPTAQPSLRLSDAAT